MAREYRPDPEMVERCVRALREARGCAHFDPLPDADDSDEAMVRAVLHEAVAYRKERRAHLIGKTGGSRNRLGVLRPPEIPKPAWRALLNQVLNAERRGIAFEMSPDEWWAWWQQDGRWQRRGYGKDKLVMARIGDAGPYAIGNIYCTTHTENLRDARANGRMVNVRGGRRKKLSAEHVEQAKVLLVEGCTFKEVAKRVGVSRDTLYSYLPGGSSALQAEKRS